MAEHRVYEPEFVSSPEDSNSRSSSAGVIRRDHQILQKRTANHHPIQQVVERTDWMPNEDNRVLSRHGSACSSAAASITDEQPAAVLTERKSLLGFPSRSSTNTNAASNNNHGDDDDIMEAMASAAAPPVATPFHRGGVERHEAETRRFHPRSTQDLPHSHASSRRNSVASSTSLTHHTVNAIGKATPWSAVEGRHQQIDRSEGPLEPLHDQQELHPQPSLAPPSHQSTMALHPGGMLASSHDDNGYGSDDSWGGSKVTNTHQPAMTPPPELMPTAKRNQEDEQEHLDSSHSDPPTAADGDDERYGRQVAKAAAHAVPVQGSSQLSSRSEQLPLSRPEKPRKTDAEIMDSFGDPGPYLLTCTLHHLVNLDIKQFDRRLLRVKLLLDLHPDLGPDEGTVEVLSELIRVTSTVQQGGPASPKSSLKKRREEDNDDTMHDDGTTTTSSASGNVLTALDAVGDVTIPCMAVHNKVKRYMYARSGSGGTSDGDEDDVYVCREVSFSFVIEQLYIPTAADDRRGAAFAEAETQQLCRLPFTLDVQEVLDRKIKGFLLNTRGCGQAGLSFAVSNNDSEGYRSRLSDFLSVHNKDGLKHISAILNRVTEIDVFTKLNQKYGLVDYAAVVKEYLMLYRLGDETGGNKQQKQTLSGAMLNNTKLAMETLKNWELQEEELLRMLVVEHGPLPRDIPYSVRAFAFAHEYDLDPDDPLLQVHDDKITYHRFAENMKQLVKTYGREPAPPTYLYSPIVGHGGKGLQLLGSPPPSGFRGNGVVGGSRPTSRQPSVMFAESQPTPPGATRESASGVLLQQDGHQTVVASNSPSPSPPRFSFPTPTPASQPHPSLNATQLQQQLGHLSAASTPDSLSGLAMPGFGNLQQQGSVDTTPLTPAGGSSVALSAMARGGSLATLDDWEGSPQPQHPNLQHNGGTYSRDLSITAPPAATAIVPSSSPPPTFPAAGGQPADDNSGVDPRVGLTAMWSELLHTIASAGIRSPDTMIAYLDDDSFLSILEELHIQPQDRVTALMKEKQRRVSIATTIQAVQLGVDSNANMILRDFLSISGLLPAQCKVERLQLCSNSQHRALFEAKLNELMNLQHAPPMSTVTKQQLVRRGYVVLRSELDALQIPLHGGTGSSNKGPAIAANDGPMLVYDTPWDTHHQSGRHQLPWCSKGEDVTGMTSGRPFTASVVVYDVATGIDVLDVPQAPPASLYQLAVNPHQPPDIHAVRCFKNNPDREAIAVYSPQQLLPIAILTCQFQLAPMTPCANHPNEPIMDMESEESQHLLQRLHAALASSSGGGYFSIPQQRVVEECCGLCTKCVLQKCLQHESSSSSASGMTTGILSTAPHPAGNNDTTTANSATLQMIRSASSAADLARAATAIVNSHSGGAAHQDTAAVTDPRLLRMRQMRAAKQRAATQPSDESPMREHQSHNHLMDPFHGLSAKPIAQDQPSTRQPNQRGVSFNDSPATQVESFATSGGAALAASERIKEGWRFFRAGQIGDAVELWISIQDDFGLQCAEGYEALGIVTEVVEKNPDKAVRLYTQALDINPCSTSVMFRCANLLDARLGRTQEALELLDAAQRFGDSAAGHRADVIRRRRLGGGVGSRDRQMQLMASPTSMHHQRQPPTASMHGPSTPSLKPLRNRVPLH